MTFNAPSRFALPLVNRVKALVVEPMDRNEPATPVVVPMARLPVLDEKKWMMFRRGRPSR